MIQIEIPGREQPLELDALVLDYNGTIACDGQLIEGVGERIRALSAKLPVYILTADTYGTVRRQCEGLGAEILTFPRAAAGECKEEIVRKLALDHSGCVVGNGFNDHNNRHDQIDRGERVFAQKSPDKDSVNHGVECAEH